MPSAAVVGVQEPQAPEEPSVWQGWDARLSKAAAPRDLKDIQPFHPSQLDLADIIHRFLSSGEPQTLAQQCSTYSRGRPAATAEAKTPSGSRSVWCKPCPWEENPCKCTPHWMLLPGPNSWDKTPCLLLSEPAELFTGTARDQAEEREDRPALCSIFRTTVPFILCYADLSMCSPMCHTRLQKLF